MSTQMSDNAPSSSMFFQYQVLEDSCSVVQTSAWGGPVGLAAVYRRLRGAGFRGQRGFTGTMGCLPGTVVMTTQTATSMRRKDSTEYDDNLAYSDGNAGVRARGAGRARQRADRGAVQERSCWGCTGGEWHAGGARGA